MPSIGKLFLSLSLAFALAQFASAAPATENLSQADIEIDHPRVSYEMGFYNASDPKCNFGGPWTEFVYVDINTYGDV